MTQGFGENAVLYREAVGCNGHNGIDIAVMPEGTPLLASAGVVVEIKNNPNGYGKHLRIFTDPDEQGNFLELTYGHCRNINIDIGERVSDGQAIAEMGNSGFVVSGSTPYWGNAPAGKGVHLHFGVREMCHNRNTGTLVNYTYVSGYVKNYNNGFFGAVDPLPYLIEGLKYQLSLWQKLLEALTLLAGFNRSDKIK